MDQNSKAKKIKNVTFIYLKLDGGATLSIRGAKQVPLVIFVFLQFPLLLLNSQRTKKAGKKG